MDRNAGSSAVLFSQLLAFSASSPIGVQKPPSPIPGDSVTALQAPRGLPAALRATAVIHQPARL